MTTPLPGDVVLWRQDYNYNYPEFGKHNHNLPGAVPCRARPVAADDAVLAAVDALRAIVSATVRFGEPPVPLIEQARKALEVVDGR